MQWNETNKQTRKKQQLYQYKMKKASVTFISVNGVYFLFASPFKHLYITAVY